MNEKRMIPHWLYYLLVTSLTNLVFIVFGSGIYILFSTTAKPDTALVVIIFYILLVKILIAAFVTNSAHKQGRFDLKTGTSFIGLYFGRFYGIFIGGFIGFQLGNGIGALAGAFIFYFVGRWAGSKVGNFTGHLLESI